MDNKFTFGSFLIQKRMERDISARQLAISLDISAVYMCDIEKTGVRYRRICWKKFRDFCV